MNEIDRESALKNSANKVLNNYVESLDSETLSKIGSARRRALQTYNRSKYGVFSSFLLSAGGVAVAGFALFVVLKMPTTTELEFLKTGEDMGVLASAEDLEFYDELEFYQWLDEENLIVENRS